MSRSKHAHQTSSTTPPNPVGMPETLSRWQRIKAAAGRVVSRVKHVAARIAVRVKTSRPVRAVRRATLRPRIWLVTTYRRIARNPYAKTTYIWFRRVMALWVLSFIVAVFVVAPVGTLIIIGAVLLFAFLASLGYSHARQAASPFVSGVARGVGTVASVLRVVGLVAIAIPTIVVMTTVAPFAIATGLRLALELGSLYMARNPGQAQHAAAKPSTSWNARTTSPCEACGGDREVNVDGLCFVCEFKDIVESARATARST